MNLSDICVRYLKKCFQIDSDRNSYTFMGFIFVADKKDR